MKKRLTKRLVLNKETISNVEMRDVKGGWYTTLFTIAICPNTTSEDTCPDAPTENIYICTGTSG